MKPGLYEAGGSDCYAQVLSVLPLWNKDYYKLKINLISKRLKLPMEKRPQWYKVPKTHVAHWVKINNLHY